MNVRMAAMLALFFAMAGCAATGAPHDSGIPDGLFRPATQTSNIVLKHTQSVGVIFTENTRTNLAYLEHYHSVAQKSNLLDEQIQQAYVSSSDPTLAIDWLNTSLQAQFASVDFYDSLDALIAARPDVIVLLDTHSTLVTVHNPDVQASIVAQFFDAGLNYIGKAEGSANERLTPAWAVGKGAPEIAAQINEQHSVQVNALEKFDASLDNLINAKS